MPIGSPDLTIESLDGMDNEHLISEVKKAKEELFNLRFQAATGQLDSHGRIKAVRRDVARIYTVLRERELGIRTAPKPVSGEAAKGAKKTKKATSSKTESEK